MRIYPQKLGLIPEEERDSINKTYGISPTKAAQNEPHQIMGISTSQTWDSKQQNGIKLLNTPFFWPIFWMSIHVAAILYACPKNWSMDDHSHINICDLASKIDMEDCKNCLFPVGDELFGQFLSQTQTSIQLASTILDNIHIMDFKTHHVVLLGYLTTTIYG